MNVVFIIPTGLGCDIGGHAGDATPAARLIAQCCDKIILHPNVVNASDINEMPSNALYVEGSMLNDFLYGKIGLKEVLSNRVAVAVNKGMVPDVINAVSASRATTGVDAEIVVLNEPLIMNGWVAGCPARAVGSHAGVESLIAQFRSLRDKYDALAIVTEITVGEAVAIQYFKTGGVNPWGGIEAVVSRMISQALRIPVAHAPVESTATKGNPELFNLPYTEIVDPRIAAEVMALGYCHCVIKGLHRAPQIGNDINRSSVICLVTPANCIGNPHEACFMAGIPVIAVNQNDSHQGRTDNRIIYVENYIEAAGMVSLLQSGVTAESVTKIRETKIL